MKREGSFKAVEVNIFPFTHILANSMSNTIHAWLGKDYRSSGRYGSNMNFECPVLQVTVLTLTIMSLSDVIGTAHRNRWSGSATLKFEDIVLEQYFIMHTDGAISRDELPVTLVSTDNAEIVHETLINEGHAMLKITPY